MKRHVIIGFVLIALGVIANPWILVKLVSADGHISNPFSYRVILNLIFSLALLVVGYLTAKGRRFRVSWQGLLVSFFTFLFLFLILEGGLRAFFWARNRVAPADRERTELLGWQTTAYQSNDNYDEIYGQIAYSTTHYGFRSFGNLATPGVKFWVIGDSYTQAAEVSDGLAYYDVLGDRLDSVEVFAYGCGGYGTLQEYMIMDIYFDTIQPDLIIWQFCSNDLINNSHYLESRSFRHNNLMTRPYWVDGEIKMLFPRREQGFVGRVVQSSYLLRFINTRVNMLRAPRHASIEDDLDAGNPLLLEAQRTLVEILGMARRRAGGVPIVAFSVDEAWSEVFSAACREAGVLYIPGIAQRLQRAKEEGVQTDGSPYDLHWNATGHMLAAEALLAFFQTDTLFRRQAGSSAAAFQFD